MRGFDKHFINHPSIDELFSKPQLSGEDRAKILESMMQAPLEIRRLAQSAYERLVLLGHFMDEDIHDDQ